MCAGSIESVCRCFKQTGTGGYALSQRSDRTIKIDAGLNFTKSSLSPEHLADVARQLDWTLEARSVMVFPVGAASPIKRVEIEIDDPTALPATANAIATAVESWGIALRVAYESLMPDNEVWVTIPGHDEPCIIWCPTKLLAEQFLLSAPYQRPRQQSASPSRFMIG